MLRRLSVRIALLIIILGPILLIGTIILTSVYIRSGGSRYPLILLELPLIALLIPLILGAVAARMVSEPLRDFADALAKLRAQNYSVRLKKSDIQEFDHITTEINNLSQRLHTEDELRRNLISDTSHELNTPVAALLGQLQGIHDGILEPTPERLGLLLKETERLNELIQRLHEYSSLRAAAIKPKLTIVNLGDILRYLTHLYGGQLQAKNMSLKMSVPKDATVTADPHLLTQILTSLLANAIKHSNATTITVSATPEHLIVGDNGAGVPDAALPFLFERFYRVDPSRSRATGGLGLGLAIVRELCEAQGWTITVRNAHPGLEYTIKFTPSS